MKSIRISELKPGYILSQNVTKNATILLPEGTVLTSGDIERLENHSIREVYIYDESDFEEEKSIKIEFSNIETIVEVEEYEKWTEQLERVKDIAHLKENPEEIDEIADNIYKKFMKKDDIVLNLFRAIGDESLSSHSINTAIISSVISTRLKMPEVFTQQLVKASLLHDIGYNFLEKRVIFDYENLENKEIKLHVISGYKVMKSLEGMLSKEIINAILQHHERYDGTGIILHLQNENINPFSRILQIGDAYDSYVESGKTPYESMSYLLKNSGKIFDPYYVSTFFSIVGLYPTGTKVLLNNGEIGVVIKKGNAAVFPIITIDNKIIETGPESGLFIREVVQ